MDSVRDVTNSGGSNSGLPSARLAQPRFRTEHVTGDDKNTCTECGQVPSLFKSFDAMVEQHEMQK